MPQKFEEEMEKTLQDFVRVSTALMRIVGRYTVSHQLVCEITHVYNSYWLTFENANHYHEHIVIIEVSHAGMCVIAKTPQSESLALEFSDLLQCPLVDHNDMIVEKEKTNA